MDKCAKVWTTPGVSFMSFYIADPAHLGGGRLDPRLKLLYSISPAPRTQELSPVKERMREKKRVRTLNRFLVHRDRTVQMDDLLIPGEDRTIPVRIYKPSLLSPCPILIYLHGGGWVVGDVNQSDPVCRRLAKQGECIVISIDYRLAPENKFPAALEDSLFVLDWVFKNGVKMGGDPARLGIAGGSAGGTLATVACLSAFQQGYPPITFQILFNPVTNLAEMDTDSHRKYGGGGSGITTQALRRRCEQYLEAEDQRYDPRVSPLLTEDLRGLPPALILTAEFDPLRDEAEEYAAKLENTGIKVCCVRYLGVTHGFFNFGGFLPQADAALCEAAYFIQHASSSLS